MEPSLRLQTAVRERLVETQAVTDLVVPDQIRAGSTRPESFPTIILATPQTINLGQAGGGFYLARCFLDLHIWAIDQGQHLAQEIGVAVMAALWEPVICDSNDVDDYQRPSFRYMRDPDPERAYRHGVGTIGAVVGWQP